MNVTYAPKHANSAVIDGGTHTNYVGRHRAEVKIVEMKDVTCRGCTGTCCTGVGSDPCTCD